MAQTTNFLFRKQLPKQRVYNKSIRTNISDLDQPKEVRAYSQQNPKILIKQGGQTSIERSQQKRSKRKKVMFSSVENTISKPIDIQLVEGYFEEYLRSMMDQEEKNYKLHNYMRAQAQINQNMRGMLINWIIYLHQMFKMSPQTLYTTVMIIDLYLSKKQAKKKYLQLIGVSAFYIAYKYEEAYNAPKLSALVSHREKTFTKDQILKMEGDIISTLDFNLAMKTSFKFFQCLCRFCKMEQKDFHIAQYVLQLALLNPIFLEYKPSILASSSIYLINRITKKPEPWPRDLENLTNYTQEQLKNCGTELCCLLWRVDGLPNTRAIKKKFSLPQYHEVSRQKFEIKKQ